MNNNKQPQSGTPNQNKTKEKRKRNRKRGPTQALAYTSKVGSNPQPQGVATGTFRRARPMQSGLTAAGRAFLKCAFAPPDFAASGVSGVPDSFEGKSLTKKSRNILPQAYLPNQDYYYLILPTPGFSHWITNVPAGSPLTSTAVFTGIPDSSYSSMFGNSDTTTADQVDKFRYISNHVELIPTTNAMQWTGNIQLFKLPINVYIRETNGPSNANLYTISGLNGVNTQQADQYTGPYNLGCYAGAYSSSAQFQFCNIMEGSQNIPATITENAGDWGQLAPTPNPVKHYFTGFDNGFECICIRVSGIGPNPNNTALLKTWSCVEYQVVPTSALYEFQSFSPYDELALRLYRKTIQELPVGVSYLDNEGFWERVLGIIRRITTVGSFVPGPIGMASTGAGMVANAMQDLFL